MKQNSLTLTPKRRLAGVGRILSIVEDMSAFIGVLSLIAIAGIIIISVLGRHFGFYIDDEIEISTYLIVVIAYLPAAGCLRRGDFVNITFVIKLLPSGARHALLVVTNIISFLAFIIVVHACYGLFISSYRSELVSNSLLRVPIYLPQAPIVIGSALLVIRMAVTIWSSLRSLRQKERSFQNK